MKNWAMMPFKPPSFLLTIPVIAEKPSQLTLINSTTIKEVSILTLSFLRILDMHQTCRYKPWTWLISIIIWLTATYCLIMLSNWKTNSIGLKEMVTWTWLPLLLLDKTSITQTLLESTSTDGITLIHTETLMVDTSLETTTLTNLSQPPITPRLMN